MSSAKESGPKLRDRVQLLRGTGQVNAGRKTTVGFPTPGLWIVNRARGLFVAPAERLDPSQVGVALTTSVELRPHHVDENDDMCESVHGKLCR